MLPLFNCALQAFLAACSDTLGFCVRACAMQVLSCECVSPLIDACDDDELPYGVCEFVVVDWSDEEAGGELAGGGLIDWVCAIKRPDVSTDTSANAVARMDRFIATRRGWTNPKHLPSLARSGPADHRQPPSAHADDVGARRVPRREAAQTQLASAGNAYLGRTTRHETGASSSK